MNTTDLAYFIASDIKPRVYGKDLPSAVYDDWSRALARKEITVDLARSAIQYMVDENIAFKVASFYKVIKHLGIVKVAVQQEPVKLFGILPERHVARYEDPATPAKHVLIKWFYVSCPKYIPNPTKLKQMAESWAQEVKGRIVYADGYDPEVALDPF